MAAYILIGNSSIVQVLGPKVSAEMEEVTIKTVPTGITAATLVSRDAFDAGTAAPTLEAFASSIEAIIGQGKAVGGSGTTELDANGLQQYFVTFEVGYNPPGAPPGTVTVDVDVPDGLLTSEDAQVGRVVFAQAVAMIDKAYDNLVSLSGNSAPVVEE